MISYCIQGDHLGMHKIISDNLVAVSAQIVSPCKSSLSHNHET